MDITKLHEHCAAIFRLELFENGDRDSRGRSNACKVYDALVGDCFDREDCIGENFNRLLLCIEKEWFGNYRPSNSPDYYFCNYILLLYLFVERVDQIFDVINKDGKSKLFRDYHEKSFQTLRQISKWANFFKHPKEFLFTHWPKYCFATEMPQTSSGDVVIDYEFIKQHYYSEKNPRPTILENNNHVYVKIPDLENLTREFCREMNIFFDFICTNQIIADYLRQRSTIELIYESEADATPAESSEA